MFFKKSDVIATVKSHPNGEFDGTIVDINIIDNKKRTGKLLIIKYETEVGSIAQFISFEHSNKRFEVGEKEKLAALVDACGLTELHDASDLIGNTVSLQISSQPQDRMGDLIQISLRVKFLLIFPTRVSGNVHYNRGP